MLTNDTNLKKQGKNELLREKQDLLYKDKLAETESGTKHMIGYMRAMTYNSSAHRLWPSDLNFVFVTLCAILIPCALTVGFTVW